MDEQQSGHVLAGRYRLDRQLGRGAMGSVWAGIDTKLRRPVAIKVLKDRGATHQTSLARFEQEAMVVARLRSPYIVQVYDYGVEGDCPFIVMELLEGEDLGRRLKDTTHPLPLAETTRIIVQTAKGLHAAHEAGLIHRDLKPANIFLVEEHGESLAKVFDFGIAKALSGEGSDSEMTAEGVLLGTPRYMSPEQAHGAKHVDHRTDLWSLAVIAYVCVTGRQPFRGSGLGEIIASVCTQEPTPPTELVPQLPAVVDAFFEQALAKDPDRRYQSARDLGAAFAAITDASIPSLDMSLSGLGELPCPALDGTSATATGSGVFPPPPATRAGSTRVGSTQDGTLGAAAATVDRGRTRRRIGLLFGVAAALAGVGAALMLIPAGEKAASQAPGPSATASDTGAPNASGSPQTTAPGAEQAATPGGSAESASTSTAASVRSGKGGRATTAAGKGGTEPTATAAPVPTPPPTQKKTGGSGLDQFDGRF